MKKSLKLTDQIARIPLFDGLTGQHYEGLAMIVVDQIIPRGQMIFAQGDEGEGFYVVVSGRVKVFILSPDGKEQTLHIFGAGEPFGEAAVFAGEKFPAHAEALEESRVFFFPRRAFVELIGQNPSLALNMLAVLSRRLRKLASLVEDLSLKEVPGRLAAYLLYLSEVKKGGVEVQLDVSKNQLASLLGTIPETLSRILAKLSREGFIKSTGPRQIQLLDRKGLKELASGERRLA